jgi:hypothetical protein
MASYMQDPTGQKEETTVTEEFYITGDDQPLDPFLCPSYLKRNCAEIMKFLHKKTMT